MCLIHCDVSIRTAQPGGPGVRGLSGHLRRTRRPESTGWRRCGETDDARPGTAGAEESCTVYWTHKHRTESSWSSIPDTRITEAGHRPTGTTGSAPPVLLYRDGNQNQSPDIRGGQSQEDTRGPRDRRGCTGAISTDDLRHTAIRRGCPQFEDAVSHSSYVGSQGGTSCSPASRGQRAEISWQPGLFCVGSNSVESLDCSTLNCDSGRTWQLSRRMIKDLVFIQSPEGTSLTPDLPTCLGDRRFKAGRPTSIYTTPGSSIWGPGLRCQGGTEDAGNHTKTLSVLSTLCWLSNYSCRPILERIGPLGRRMNGTVRGNEGFNYT